MQKVYILTGLVYGLAVHMKICPIIYCLTLYLPLASGAGWRSLLEVSTQRLVTAALLTLTFYHLYGHDFLEHTYLYHITRRDIRYVWIL